MNTYLKIQAINAHRSEYLQMQFRLQSNKNMNVFPRDSFVVIQ